MKGKVCQGGNKMKNLSLYEITSAFPALMENEEMTDEIKQQINEELKILLQQKSENTIGYIRNMELTVEAMKSEEKRISEQRKMIENRISKFKEYVKDCMEQNGIMKVETGIGSMTIAKNPISVEIENEDEIPSEFKQEVVSIKIDKTAIKNHFKETGEIVNGVNILTSKTSLRIK